MRREVSTGSGSDRVITRLNGEPVRVSGILIYNFVAQ